MKFFSKSIGVVGLVGVVAAPPNWYYLEDWLNLGHKIQTENWMYCENNPNKCPQHNITW